MVSYNNTAHLKVFSFKLPEKQCLGSKGQNIKLLSNPKSELLKREIIKISWFLNGSSFSIKISEKNKTIFEKSTMLKKFSKFYGNNLDPDLLFSSADLGSGSGSASKLNVSLALVYIFTRHFNLTFSAQLTFPILELNVRFSFRFRV